MSEDKVWNVSITLIYFHQQHQCSKGGKHTRQNVLPSTCVIMNVKQNMWLLWLYSSLLGDLSISIWSCLLLVLLLPDTAAILTLHYETNAVPPHRGSHSYLCVLEVMSPEGSDLVLATDIPNSEADIFIFYCLHVETFTGKRDRTYLNNTVDKVQWVTRVEVHINELKITVSVSLTNGWDSGHNFTELQFVQDSRFSGSIQTNYRE